MTTEQPLSSKIEKPKENSITRFTPFFYEKDVKQALKRLQDRIKIFKLEPYKTELKEIFGEELLE